jgi:glucosamine--fructose-6-phosphate aminotransferase (isomerizing)
MCGIIGYIGSKPVVPVLLDGLRRMEYRGYDSAGVALVSPDGIELRRSAGKLINLENAIRTEPIDGVYGVGHTRWATHGRPTEENAHPHRDCTGKIVVVHNGIIENYLELKHELQAQGHTFKTETDTEIVAHLVEREMQTDGLDNAVRRALKVMRGMFAIVLVSVDDPEKIVAVRNGPPIVIGLGDNEFFVASDIPAILSHTRDVVFLGDEEMAVITRSGVVFTDYNGREVSKTTQRVLWDPIAAEKGGYKHFMLKEIYEQPTAARDTILGRVSLDRGEIFFEDLHIPVEKLKNLRKVTILACGTSWHAGLVGKYMIEALAQVPVEVDYGSEYRYRNPIVAPNELAIVITQSGETADTRAALHEATRKGAASVAICNVVGSAVTRDADGTVYTHAGPEIGVASTKAFTSQLVALQLLGLYLAQVRGTLSTDDIRGHIDELLHLPLTIEQAI